MRRKLETCLEMTLAHQRAQANHEQDTILVSTVVFGDYFGHCLLPDTVESYGTLLRPISRGDSEKFSIERCAASVNAARNTERTRAPSRYDSVYAETSLSCDCLVAAAGSRRRHCSVNSTIRCLSFSGDMPDSGNLSQRLFSNAWPAISPSNQDCVLASSIGNPRRIFRSRECLQNTERDSRSLHTISLRYVRAACGERSHWRGN